MKWDMLHSWKAAPHQTSEDHQLELDMNLFFNWITARFVAHYLDHLLFT